MEQDSQEPTLRKDSFDDNIAYRASVPRQASFIEPHVLNPFVHYLDLPWYEWMKVAIMSVTIAPIRLLILGVILGLAWIVSFIGTVGLELMEDRPMGTWRAVTTVILRRLARVAFFVGGFHWISVKGDRSAMKDAGIIVIAPHSSYLDTIVMFGCNTLPMPIARQESVVYPFIGRLLRMTQPICVNREDPKSRQNTVSEIKRRACARSEGWPPVCLFPEGTTTNRSCLINYKAGAFLPGVPVQPVVLHWPNRVDWVTWPWQGVGPLTGMWIGLCQFHNYAAIEFLPVYYPSEEERKDPKLFGNNVRKVMAEALELPMTDHSFEDCRLMMLAKKHNLPMASGIVEFSKLSRKLNLNYDSMKEMLERFTEMAARTRPRPPERFLDGFNSSRSMRQVYPAAITFDEFASHLNLIPSPALKRIFDLYDRNKSGTIDFREYVIGLSLVSAPANSSDTIRTAFQLFDTEGKGFVTRDDLTKILCSAFSMTKEQSDQLFDKIDKEREDQVNYDEFSVYADEHPEYAKLFTVYMNFETDRVNQKQAKEAKKEN